VSVVLAEPVEAGDGRQWWNLSFGYNPDVVAILKAIPKPHRRYHPETRTWSVKIGSWVRLVNALEADGHRVIR
jgi:hypothetical protein